MSVEVSSAVVVPDVDPTISQRGYDYLLAVINDHNAKGEDVFSDEDKKTLLAAYRVTSDEEKAACLEFSPEEFLTYIELLRDSIIFANEAAEFLRMTREVVRHACEAQGMPESEIVKRLRLDDDLSFDKPLTLDVDAIEL